MKLDKHVRYWNKMFSTCQIANWKLFNASLSELKFLLNKVSDSKSSYLDRGRVLKFDFFKKQSVFAKQTWNIKKTWMFLPLYKRQFLHSACIFKMHYSDWKLSENQFLSWNFERVRFWIENFSKCQFQRKKQFLKTHGFWIEFSTMCQTLN